MDMPAEEIDQTVDECKTDFCAIHLVVDNLHNAFQRQIKSFVN
jgi:hypothetical protein